jgi:large subunit ribosomal protein L24
MAGMKIKRGDRVRVLSGKDRGKEGVVLRALPSEGKVIVENINTAKRHSKPTRVSQTGGIVDKDMPIDVSNVAVIDPSDGKPTRVGYRLDADGTKTRISRRTGTEIPERGDK